MEIHGVYCPLFNYYNNRWSTYDLIIVLKSLDAEGYGEKSFFLTWPLKYWISSLFDQMELHVINQRSLFASVENKKMPVWSS